MSPAPLVPEVTPTPPPALFIPPGVLSASANADRLQAEYIASLTPVDPNASPLVPVDPQVPIDPAAPPVAPVAPVVVVEQPVTLTGNEEELPPPAPPGSPEAKWEHSFKSLQGRFKVQQTKDAGTIAALTQELQTRRAAPAPAPAPVPTPAQIDDTFTAEERETWGEELTATISRVAEAKAMKALGLVTPVINQTMENLAIQRESQMRDWLNTQISFEAVNVAPEFSAWLLLRDPMSGAIRQDMLNEAWLSVDGPRVLAICNGFLSENPGGTGLQPVVPKPPAPPAPQAPREPKVALVSLAAPGRAQVQTPVTPSPEKPVYTRQDIKDFYAARNRGFYVGKEAEAAGYEQEIFAAQREGRII